MNENKKYAASGIVFHCLNSPTYEEDCKVICTLAGNYDEYQAANDTDRQTVVDKACDILGIRLLPHEDWIV